MQLRAAGLLVISVALTVLAPDPTTPNYEIKPIVLPGANGPVTLDYFAYDPATGKYSRTAMNFVRAGGAATVLSLVGFIVVMIRKEHSR